MNIAAWQEEPVKWQYRSGPSLTQQTELLKAQKDLIEAQAALDKLQGD